MCYLQVLLAGELADVGRERLMGDMDAWGYSFRLGSTRAWFEGDAADARHWLLRRHAHRCRRRAPRERGGVALSAHRRCLSRRAAIR